MPIAEDLLATLRTFTDKRQPQERAESLVLTWADCKAIMMTFAEQGKRGDALMEVLVEADPDIGEPYCHACGNHVSRCRRDCPTRRWREWSGKYLEADDAD